VESILPAQIQEQFATKGDYGYSATWTADGYRNRIFLMPDKFFAINRRKEGMFGDNEHTFFALDQFFPDNADNPSLEELSDRATELENAFALLGVSNITNLSSPVRAVEESGLLDAVYKSMPDTRNIPIGVQQYAVEADAYGAWNTAYQVGCWKNTYSYDLASAYPSVAARLLSLDGATYEFSKSMVDNATYGFVKGKLFINPDHPLAFCSPITSNDTVGNPVGTLNDCFSLEQIRYIERNELGRFDIGKGGGWFIHIKSGTRPLAATLEHYYQLRKRSALLSMVCKRVIDGIIGQLGQFKQGEPTAHTNTVYHAIIRNSVSLLVHQCLCDNAVLPSELLYVNNDGFHTTRKLPYTVASGMGKWRGKSVDQLVVLSPEDITTGTCDELLKGFAPIHYQTKQNRYFKKFPVCKADLMSKHYMSEPIIL
jgi:hypothetical protein